MSPMPGSLVSLAVDEGSEVVEGEPIGVLEAMKMQNVMKAERSGTVKSVLVVSFFTPRCALSGSR